MKVFQVIRQTNHTLFLSLIIWKLVCSLVTWSPVGHRQPPIVQNQHHLWLIAPCSCMTPALPMPHPGPYFFVDTPTPTSPWTKILHHKLVTSGNYDDSSSTDLCQWINLLLPCTISFLMHFLAYNNTVPLKCKFKNICTCHEFKHIGGKRLLDSMGSPPPKKKKKNHSLYFTLPSV